MRLFLLPISTRQSLIYCQRLNQQLTTQTTTIDKITSKAAATWVNWEKRDSGWQKKVTTYGNKLFQRLPYEEWGLKSIPPLSARRKREEVDGIEDVRLEYPEAFIEPQTVQDDFQNAMEISLQDLEDEIQSVNSGADNHAVAGGQEERLLLSETSGKLIAEYVDVPELAMEIERAVWQVEKSVKSKQELREEKKDLEAANQKGSKQ
ncbi:hypothetical protein P7C71_g962, partial [Lecanoromycetidae sp. Uapishka_2]